MKTRFIREQLEHLGKTPEWLAEQCGVSPVTMKGSYLRGITPSKPILMLMAQALGCTPVDLIHEEEAEGTAETA